MITYLTIDKDGAEASLDLEEIYKYRGGFERKEDGSYVKLLGDERCITAKREKARILKQLEDKKNNSLKTAACPRRFTMIEDVKYTLKQIEKMFENPTKVELGSKKITATMVRLPITFPSEITMPNWVSKIEANETTGRINYWLNCSWKDEPDFFIDKVIIPEPPNEQPPQEQNIEADQQLVGA